MFKAGKVAMVEYGRWVMVDFQKQPDLNWDITPLPKGKRKDASLIIGLGFCIPEGSAHPQEAYEFMKFLTSTEALRKETALGLRFPARKSVAEASDFLALDPNHNLQAFIDSMEFARMYPHTPFLFRIEQIVNEQLENLYLGYKTVQQTCDDITAEVDALLAAGLK